MNKKIQGKPIEEICVKDSTYKTHSLRRKLLNNDLIENKCAICGLLPIWNGNPLTLQLDHINGINNDHRLNFKIKLI